MSLLLYKLYTVIYSNFIPEEKESQIARATGTMWDIGFECRPLYRFNSIRVENIQLTRLRQFEHKIVTECMELHKSIISL